MKGEESMQAAVATRGFTLLFWAMAAWGAGLWTLDAWPTGWVRMAAAMAYVPLLGAGLWTVETSMDEAAVRRGRWMAVPSTAAGVLTPYWVWWKAHPGVEAFAWTAAALVALWAAMMWTAAMMTRHYAGRLGDGVLRGEANLTLLLLPWLYGICACVAWRMAPEGMGWSAAAWMKAASRAPAEARLCLAAPMLLTTCLLWNAKEAGWRRVLEMAGKGEAGEDNGDREPLEGGDEGSGDAGDGQRGRDGGEEGVGDA